MARARRPSEALLLPSDIPGAEWPCSRQRASLLGRLVPPDGGPREEATAESPWPGPCLLVVVSCPMGSPAL